MTADKQRGTLGATRQKIARLGETLEKAMNGNVYELKQKRETNTRTNKRGDKQICSAPTDPGIGLVADARPAGRSETT